MLFVLTRSKCIQISPQRVGGGIKRTRRWKPLEGITRSFNIYVDIVVQQNVTSLSVILHKEQRHSEGAALVVRLELKHIVHPKEKYHLLNLIVGNAKWWCLGGRGGWLMMIKKKEKGYKRNSVDRVPIEWESILWAERRIDIDEEVKHITLATPSPTFSFWWW